MRVCSDFHTGPEGPELEDEEADDADGVYKAAYIGRKALSGAQARVAIVHRVAIEVVVKP